MPSPTEHPNSPFTVDLLFVDDSGVHLYMALSPTSTAPEESMFNLGSLDLTDRMILHQANVLPVPNAEISIADSGPKHHATSDMTYVFDTRPLPPGNERVDLGGGNVFPVKAVGSLTLRFYQRSKSSPPPTKTGVILTDVYVLEGIQFNIFSTHQAQKSQTVIGDRDGVNT